ncbi:MAG: SpoIIE family protein phosphatase [Candidatus Latescibacterota bacterium]|nr:MAG: SpoIIE family protein phosphatase [Candidatus Latescibacterota bacterium]
MSDKGFISKLSNSVFGKGSGKVDLAKENARLKRAVEELSALNDIALTVGTTADPQTLVERLVGCLMRAAKAEQASVTLLRGPARNTAETELRLMATSVEMPRYHMDQGFLGWLELNKKPLVINDPAKDDRFKGMDWDPSINSVMCVPLLVKSEMIGALTVYNKKGGGGFTEEDQRLLPIIAAQSAQIIDNTRLIKENAGMQEQVKLAYEIQRNLLPSEPPYIDGYDVAGTSIPAQTVGGDYYDFIQTQKGGWAVCLGDVSGKGLPASLLMANTQATLRGQTLVEADVNERIARANKLIYQSTDDEKFVTLFYGILDVARHDISFVNAGHEPAIVVSSEGAIERLETGGMALGVVDDFPYKQETRQLAPGDVLIVYSDGVPDATNISDDAFGIEKLMLLAKEMRNEPTAVIVEKIVGAVNEHAGEAPQMDDVTLVVVKRAR